MAELQHVAEFSKFGKSFQMQVRDGLDLEEVIKLDEALWGAISAPADVLIPDPVLRAMIDESKKGRITSREMRTAIAWMLKQLPDHEKIVPEFDGKLAIASINSEDEEAKALASSAQYVLEELKAEDKSFITLQQVRSFLGTVTAFPLNGDGVITVKAATASATMQQQVTDMVNDVVAANGGAKDLDGSFGLDQATMDAFMAEVPKYVEWYDKGQIPQDETVTDIMTMGADTAALSAIVQANAGKIDRFFQLCELLGFDSRISGREISHSSRIDTFDPSLPDVVNNFQDSLPIAPPNVAGRLPLDAEKVSPSFRAWMSDFASKVVPAVLGSDRDSLSKAEWNTVKAAFAPYCGWLASKPSEALSKIPVERLRSYLDCAPLLAEVSDLMTRDKVVSDIAAAARQVERLILYRENLLRLANNFVNFSELYDINRTAIFECGKMVIDGRWFEVAFKLDKPATHIVIGAASQMFLMYVEVDMAPAPAMNVVIPVTNGSKGNLFVGKRGVFYDMQGLDHDAKIVKIQENPICLLEAILSPFSRLWGIIETKLTSWSKASETKLQKQFTTAINVDPKKAAAAPPPPAPAADGKDGKFNTSAFMGIGVVVAALGSSLAFISKTLSSMSGLQIWMTVIIALLALMLPISIIAIIKLNRQDISAILEGCGWGINLPLRLNGKVRRNFTHYGRYPVGAKGTPRSQAFMWISILVLVVLLIFGGCRAHGWWKCHKAEKAKQVQMENCTKTAECSKPCTAPAAKPAAPAAKPAAPAAKPAAPAAKPAAPAAKPAAAPAAK